VGLDYYLIQATDPWQIQILTIGPAHIQPGAVILVTYTVQTNPSGTFYTLANQSQIRLSFWHEMAAVFLRYNISDSHASSPGFVLQNDEMIQTGAEFTWRNLSLYGDYTDDHSTLYDIRAFNLAEGYSLNIASDSTLRLDLSQQWSDNSYDTGNGSRVTDHLTFYNFMLHHDWHPLPTFSWNTEIGYRLQRGLGLNQDLFAARTYVNWRRGKLELHVGYEHEFQELVLTSRDRDFGFVRVRRNF
jgi:hypothetical protein